MKRLTLIFVCLLSLCTTIVKADNERPIQVSQLPPVARQFISKYFSDRKVALAKVETEMMSKSYEVIFSNGDHIDFDGKGNWEEIDCKASSVPVAVIPVAIMDYIRANYPDVSVMKIEKDRREYEVKLSNRIELAFDLNFNLTDIEM